MATKDKKGAAKGGKGASGKGAKTPPTKPKVQQAGGKGGKKGGGQREQREYVRPEHTGVGLEVPAPRLKLYYETKVREKIAAKFDLKNKHEIPNVTKIVINVGVGAAVKNSRLLDNVVEELGLITGQAPVRKKAKKSIANFGLREGQEIGAAVTLRGARMWEFLDRFINIAVPRIRDFRGLNHKAFDGRGNLTIGIKEQMIFPEINYDMVDQIHGMDITFVTTAKKDDQALTLLRELGMPFKGEEKPVIVNA